MSSPDIDKAKMMDWVMSQRESARKNMEESVTPTEALIHAGRYLAFQDLLVVLLKEDLRESSR